MEAQNIEGKIDHRGEAEGPDLGSIIKNMFSRKKKVRTRIDPTPAKEPTRKDEDSLENQRLYSSTQYRSTTTDATSAHARD